MMHRQLQYLWPVFVLMLAGCSAATWQQSAPEYDEQAASVDLPKSKQGNPPFYEVYGKRYTVMQTSVGYREQGIASWYGKKFHGRSTSNGERYDMYAMTAAHKTLPLPTNVRVTNVETGKSIIVRVNDRGPFVKNRIIDLSYTAALELDVVANGTAVVEIEALTGTRPQPAPADKPVIAANPGEPVSASNDVNMYLQVGAFGEQSNAQKLADQLTDGGIGNVQVHESNGDSPKLFRVRIGPLDSVTEYDRLSLQVETMQIAETHLVVESEDPADSKAASATGGVSGG
jgi:rare lipoprotein A